MQEHTREPLVLSEGEYLYLTERLEPLSEADLRGDAAARFVVRSRKAVLSEVVRAVLEHELTRDERAVAALLFIEGESVAAASRQLGVSRQRVYTLAGSAERKLRMYLKYPLLLDFSLARPCKPIEELAKRYRDVLLREKGAQAAGVIHI